MTYYPEHTYFYLNGTWGLTGAQSRRRNFDLAGSLVGMKGRCCTAAAQVCSEQVGALRPRGAGAGAIASVVGLLFVIYRYQLEEKQQKDGSY